MFFSNADGDMKGGFSIGSARVDRGATREQRNHDMPEAVMDCRCRASHSVIDSSGLCGLLKD